MVTYNIIHTYTSNLLELYSLLTIDNNSIFLSFNNTDNATSDSIKSSVQNFQRFFQ